MEANLKRERKAENVRCYPSHWFPRRRPGETVFPSIIHFVYDNESPLESASNEMLMPNKAIEVVARPRQKPVECYTCERVRKEAKELKRKRKKEIERERREGRREGRE